MTDHPAHDPGQLPYGEYFSLDNVSSVFNKILEDGLVKAMLSAAAIAFHWVFDSRTEALIALTSLIFLDTLSGAFKAYKKASLSSSGFFRCALKAVVYFTLMATGALVDKVMPIPFATIVMTTFLAATEGISIMENLGSLGYAVPTALIKKLKLLRDQQGGDDKPS